jgi:predicted permease
VLLFAVAASLLSGLVFGLMPVIRYARPRLATALHAGGRALSDSRERLRARGVLVVVQVALALVLLVCAGLMIRTFHELNNVNPGFARPEEVQTVRISIPTASVSDPELTVRRENEILDRLAALPGATSVAFITNLPMGGGTMADLIVPEGKVFANGEPPRAAQSRFLSPGLFATLRIPMVLGRDLTWTDIYERRPVVVISENLARREWGSAEKALGKRVRGSSAADQFREVVGVAGDVHDRGLSQPVMETVYFPVMGERVYNNPVYAMRSVVYAIRSPRTGTPAFLDEIRQAVWSVDPNLPLAGVSTMGELVENSLARTSFTLVMLAIAGTMALLLGVIGIYGVIAYAVSRRTREVGIRVALGARGNQVRGMFVRQGLVLAAVGVAIGLVGAAALTRWMSSLLFAVSPLDPLTYAAVAAVLVFAAVAASYLPAMRAASIDPVEALKAE